MGVVKMNRTAEPLVREENRLRWLLDFLVVDLSALREGQSFDLSEDVLVFALEPIKVPGETGRETSRGKRGDKGISQGLHRELQAEVRKGVDRLMSGNDWRLPTAPSVLRLRPELGRLHPVGIALASLLMSLLYLGGESAQMELGLPSAITGVFQGVLLFFLLAADLFINFRVRLAPRAAPRPAEAGT